MKSFEERRSEIFERAENMKKARLSRLRAALTAAILTALTAFGVTAAVIASRAPEPAPQNTDGVPAASEPGEGPSASAPENYEPSPHAVFPPETEIPPATESMEVPTKKPTEIPSQAEPSEGLPTPATDPGEEITSASGDTREGFAHQVDVCFPTDVGWSVDDEETFSGIRDMLERLIGLPAVDPALMTGSGFTIRLRDDHGALGEDIAVRRFTARGVYLRDDQSGRVVRLDENDAAFLAEFANSREAREGVKEI